MGFGKERPSKVYYIDQVFDKAITSIRTSGDITSEILLLYICINDQYLVNIYIFFLRILSIFNTYTHGEMGEDFLKKLIVVYIQKGLIIVHISLH